MDGRMDGGLSSIKVLFLSAFLLQDGGSANAGQCALEMSPGTSYSACLLPEGSDALLFLAPAHQPPITDDPCSKPIVAVLQTFSHFFSPPESPR